MGLLIFKQVPPLTNRKTKTRHMIKFDLKHISFLNRPCTIVCQNENGPCPLIALANALLLSGKIFIHQDNRIITLPNLLEITANFVLETPESPSIQSQVQLNEVLQLLPGLINGLDLNVRFTGVNDFEFTRELSVFDIAQVPILHGWILDRQDVEAAEVIGRTSYNQLLNQLIEYKSLIDAVKTTPSPPVPVNFQSSEESVNSGTESTAQSVTDLIDLTQQSGNTDVVKTPVAKGLHSNTIIPSGVESQMQLLSVVPSQGSAEAPATTAHALHAVDSPSVLLASPTVSVPLLKSFEAMSIIEVSRRVRVIERFLSETASQLTYEGLHCLHKSVRDGQLAVFFRNNHFSTLYRHGDDLYLLVTDLGYRQMPLVVWERLDQIDG